MSPTKLLYVVPAQTDGGTAAYGGDILMVIRVLLPTINWTQYNHINA